MSTIVDDPAEQLAVRVKSEREARAWSLAEFAERSGVSKAMLSKIEREEVSPTAVILARIANAFGLTLAGLLAAPGEAHTRHLRADEQPRWRDPATGYVRRQVFQSADNPLELIEVNLPAGARVAMPAASYRLIKQVVWLLSGRLRITDGGEAFDLKPGDSYEYGPPADTEFRNTGEQSCRYLVALVRK